MAQPFARARAMFALIAAAMGDMAKLAAIGPYRSRGKGGRHSKPGRNYRASRSKYMPHQGAQERERRIVGGWHKGHQILHTKRDFIEGMRSSHV